MAAPRPPRPDGARRAPIPAPAPAPVSALPAGLPLKGLLSKPPPKNWALAVVGTAKAIAIAAIVILTCVT